jgi:hypothetical protein
MLAVRVARSASECRASFDSTIQAGNDRNVREFGLTYLRSIARL